MENTSEMNENPKELTVGEIRLGIKFEPGNNDLLQNTLESYAHQYNRLEKLKKPKPSVPGVPDTYSQELVFIKSAQNNLLISAYFAAYAITGKPRPLWTE